MKVYDYVIYTALKEKFLREHDSDFEVNTSSMDEYGCYHKEYVCADGAIWYEVMSPETRKITTTIGELATSITVEVKFLRTEFWSSDDAESAYYYEQF